MATSTTNFLQWTLPEATGIDALKLDESASIGELADDELLVELHAASLNHRELAVIRNTFPAPFSASIRSNLIPGSDGAGIVKDVGKNVKEFHPGDRVVTHMTPQLSDDEPPTFANICAGIGHGMDGTLRQYGRFKWTALVHAPQSLNFEEAATLTCSGLTAYNALFGLRGREVKAGDWVLVQGTGGVSVAALQFAIAVGATVVATTSTEAKADRLKALGAKAVINYKTTPEWGLSARELTPDGRGFDLIVDVGGEATLGESVKATRTDCTVVAAGLVGGATKESVPMMAALFNACTVRGILLGTRVQFQEMVKFVDEKKVKPVLDEQVFNIRETKEAMRFLERQGHFSKVAIKLR
jgi:NADPH:quinone reductase-like Zn-dependent oxidoreductase